MTASEQSRLLEEWRQYSTPCLAAEIEQSLDELAQAKAERVADLSDRIDRLAVLVDLYQLRTDRAYVSDRWVAGVDRSGDLFVHRRSAPKIKPKPALDETIRRDGLVLAAARRIEDRGELLTLGAIVAETSLDIDIVKRVRKRLDSSGRWPFGRLADPRPAWHRNRSKSP